MAIPSVSREALVASMAQFDRELRDTPTWLEWERKGAFRYAIAHEQRRYPVKQIIRMATGVRDFSGGEEANTYVRDRGLEIVDLSPIREGLERIMAEYATAKKEPYGRSNRLWGHFDALVESIKGVAAVGDYPDIRVTWGAGKGQWASIPWAALSDTRETSTIQSGIYCVFLFRKDMSGVYLTLNQGVTKPTGELGVQAGRKWLGDNAKELRRSSQELTKREFLLDDRIDLQVEHGIGADYEVSTVAYKLYEARRVPPDDSLEADLTALLGVYRKLIDAKAEKGQRQVNDWIFQANPNLYDIRPALRVLSEMTWLVRQHKDRIREGDRVFVWESGQEGGVIAIATVLAGPAKLSQGAEEGKFNLADEKFDGEQDRVRIRIDRVLADPIPRNALIGHPLLGSLSILAAPQGTNFAVTRAQADALVKLLEAPASHVALPHEALPNPDLAAISADFGNALKECYLEFGGDHERVVRAFVASLAAKRFAILTGLSGSGKTQIAIKFGQWLGPWRYKVVSVRPDWTGPEALFGYEDALKSAKDGKRGWHVPEALQFILRAVREPKKPFALILDEMNLAHVERYFADALSGMESGEVCVPNLQVGSDGIWREASGEPPFVPFPRNLAVIGTVNVDETTYLFSPKVLDRANTFEFRVRTSDLQATARKPVDLAPGDPALVSGFQVIASSDEWHLQNPAPWADDFADQLRVLHKLLGEASLEFGHRIYFEAMRFAAMHVAAGEPSLEAALDRQVLQKILPRLHGARRRLEATLCALGRYCQDLACEPGSAYPGAPITFDPTQADPEIAKLPLSLDKIRRMTLTLRANQFTSFTD